MHQIHFSVIWNGIILYTLGQVCILSTKIYLALVYDKLVFELESW